MCRLLALATRAPTTMVDVLGEDLESFVDLSRQHADGWGMAWYDGAGGLSVAKDVGPAHTSDLLEKLSRTVDSDLALLHLRRATPGLAVALENTHPFSERYFLALLAGLEQAGSVEQALPDLFEQIAGGYRYTALNFVLLTSERLYAACVFNPDEEAARLREDPAYYHLPYRVSPDTVVVGSSGWSGLSGGAWRTLSNGQALVVERRTLATRVLELI